MPKFQSGDDTFLILHIARDVHHKSHQYALQEGTVQNDLKNLKKEEEEEEERKEEEEEKEEEKERK